MDLIKQLVDGTVEYRDNGEVIRHPSTATMLRAARVLTAMDREHTANLNILLKCQQYNNELLQELDQLRNELNDTRNSIPDNIESVCNGEQEATAVAHDGNGPCSSDTAGEGCGAN